MLNSKQFFRYAERLARCYKKSSFSNDQALGTLIHEMGHAFGLAHYNSNPNSIMCQTNKGRKVQRVQKTDNDTINAIY